ncbi:dihydrodipicolinate synthase family protein [Sciscionella sediminilitoris]|uniref:dihydrodipicolinate synthase family protein n=1 Tax=Sciscionella sediminilitoris TaxID=1445613 RepID=UPI0004DED2A3|nr:dihydrodipicolinate synthase family protein [Sciscionella sp. SE31]
MDRRDVTWRGYWSALPTPFTEAGELDLAAFEEIVERYIADGVHGLLVNGSTGEWAAQSLEERERLAEAAVRRSNGRVPVVIGVTSSRPHEAARLARHAERAGADSVMAAPPPATRPTPEELRWYYETVFGAVTLPAWVYNFPQDAATDIRPERFAELADLPNVVGVKQSTASLDDLLATIRAVGDRLVVFGHLLSPLGLSLLRGGFGGDGHFGSGMLLGSRYSAFFELAWAGETAEPLRIAERSDALMHRLRGPGTDGYNWRYGGMQASLKAAMNLLGQPGGFPRKPKLPITDTRSLAEISAALADAGLESV